MFYSYLVYDVVFVFCFVLFFHEITDKKCFFISVPLLPLECSRGSVCSSGSGHYTKENLVIFFAFGFTGVEYVFISIHNIAVKTLSPLCMPVLTSAAVLS